MRFLLRLQALLTHITGRARIAHNSPEHLRLGAWGEEIAARLLRRKGYKILERRLRIGRRDELDLVVRDQQTLVIVEVKTRRSADFSRPSRAVDRGKRYRLSRAAVRYAARMRGRPDYLRFDVVEVVGRPGGTPPAASSRKNLWISISTGFLRRRNRMAP